MTADAITQLNVVHDVVLVTLDKVPASVEFVSRIFDRLDEAGVRVDMIFQSPLTGPHVSISFTAASSEMEKIDTLVSDIRREIPSVKPVIRRSNVKISLFGEKMAECPGIAASVFRALRDCGTDVLLITTSSADISVLISGEYLEQSLCALRENFKL